MSDTVLSPTVTADSVIDIDRGFRGDEPTFVVTVDGDPAFDSADRGDAETYAALLNGLRERACHIRGLRQLADYLEANPDLPIWYGCVSAHLAPNQAEFRRVAGLIGTEPVEKYQSFTATRKFDGDVTYEINGQRDRVAEPASVLRPSWTDPAVSERHTVWTILTYDERINLGTLIYAGREDVARDQFGDGLVDHYLRVIDGIDPATREQAGS